MVLGSCIDLDHFLLARSLSLEDATHLTQRPWGHNFLACVLVSLVNLDCWKQVFLFISSKVFG